MLILGLQTTFAKALRPKISQLYTVIFWNWGPLQQFDTTWQVVNFFSQKSMHPTLLENLTDDAIAWLYMWRNFRPLPYI